MDLALRGQVALVTGASKGIGRAVALSLSREGCSLHLAARGREALEAVVSDIVAQGGESPTLHEIDLSVQGAAAALAQSCGAVDILINNAGAIPPGDLASVDEGTWRAAWDLKVFGTIDLCRAALPAMGNRRGSAIVNIIGAAGDRPRAEYVVGSSGNAALMAFTRAVGAVSVDNGVRVVGVNPGLVATDRMETLLRDRAARRFGDPGRWRDCTDTGGRPGEPQEIADVVTFLASPRASYVSGTIITVDGGRSHRG